MRDRLTKIVKESLVKNIDYTHRLAENITDDLLANGVIVPPCKVGDKVYCIQKVFNESTLQVETIVKTRIIDFVASARFVAESEGLIFAERDFGKTVFLTREEAEQALKEVQDDKQ